MKQDPGLLSSHNRIEFRFKSTVWQHASPAGWYFVSLPARLSNGIRRAYQAEEEGWGRLKATAATGNSQWDTAIWFDSKRKAYLLPLKVAIRKKENLEAGMHIDVRLWI